MQDILQAKSNKKCLKQFNLKNPATNRILVSNTKKNNPEDHRRSVSPYKQINPGLCMERPLHPWETLVYRVCIL